MQGLGNDYIFLDCTKEMPENLPQLAVTLSNRHFGVGADGVICLCPSACATVKMRMFNADGSEGKMCGNGIRCLAKLAFDRGLTAERTLRVETLSGVKTLEVHLEDGRVASVTADMGTPEVFPQIGLETKGNCYTAIPVSMGNPHAVVFMEGIDRLDLADLGPNFEHHPAFPRRTNTEFVEVTDPTNLKMRVWERGSGETLACGTGACAALAAAVTSGRSGRRVTVHLPGGALELRWDGADGHIYMTGPAVTVFEGTI